MLENGGKVDILFTDILLPGGVDGRKLASSALHRWPGLDVLYTSGFVADDGAGSGGEIDAAIMLRKPYTGADLAAKIRLVLDESKGEV